MRTTKRLSPSNFGTVLFVIYWVKPIKTLAKPIKHQMKPNKQSTKRIKLSSKPNKP